MKHWFLCALSSTAFANAAFAARGGDEWSGLDREIEALSASSLQDADSGVHVGGLVRAAWLDAPNLLPGQKDLEGFRLLNTQLELAGQVSDHAGVRLEIEAAGGTAQVLDAYGTWRFNDLLRCTVGHFRAPLLWESQLRDSDLLFLLRTDAGELFYTRDTGAMLDGDWERLHWAVSLQNGLDSNAGRQAVCARVGVDVIGQNAGLHQGAYGVEDSQSLSVAGAFYNDSGVDKDGSTYSSDAQLKLGRFAADGSITIYGDGTNGIFATRDQAQSWSATVSYMAIPDLVEVAARYQDIDNDKNARDITFGVNYYMVGHLAKLQLNITRVWSEDPTVDETTRSGFGMTLGV